ncbi:Diphthamide biosynthesis protein 3 [Echinococcus granulosus]|uniref:Diphthamide biosynthesis protein 3 n=1 Tax=Echinococcus granulosus TaxID=6210 RepID=W6UH24_ECHGR|nr:Diphthamide biosynthesis protein 3 [Echinococcus granulosus]EUB60880.1 Diphthamide biosynthesis protein 3 [Echinococcus granulosus]
MTLVQANNFYINMLDCFHAVLVKVFYNLILSHLYFEDFIFFPVAIISRHVCGIKLNELFYNITVAMSILYDEIEIEDMEYDEEEQIYYYPCPCGDRFEISKAELEMGEDIARFSIQILASMSSVHEKKAEIDLIRSVFTSDELVFSDPSLIEELDLLAAQNLPIEDKDIDLTLKIAFSEVSCFISLFGFLFYELWESTFHYITVMPLFFIQFCRFDSANFQNSGIMYKVTLRTAPDFSLQKCFISTQKSVLNRQCQIKFALMKPTRISFAAKSGKLTKCQRKSLSNFLTQTYLTSLIKNKTKNTLVEAFYFIKIAPFIIPMAYITFKEIMA